MRCAVIFFVFFFNDTATTEIYTLSLHDALPICQVSAAAPQRPADLRAGRAGSGSGGPAAPRCAGLEAHARAGGAGAPAHPRAPRGEAGRRGAPRPNRGAVARGGAGVRAAAAR